MNSKLNDFRRVSFIEGYVFLVFAMKSFLMAWVIVFSYNCVIDR